MSSLIWAIAFSLLFFSLVNRRFVPDALISAISVVGGLTVASLVREVSNAPLFFADQQCGFAMGFLLALAVFIRLGVPLPQFGPTAFAMWAVLEFLALHTLGRAATINDYVEQSIGWYLIPLVVVWCLFRVPSWRKSRLGL